ncbi:MAG: hypothetical protein Q4G49_18235, partial [Paracoccus sp. (in: a-proteobacteria)]|nr:hypothetical protein [Paracoccus sp. (in: a-proteobacteria)]
MKHRAVIFAALVTALAAGGLALAQSQSEPVPLPPLTAPQAKPDPVPTPEPETPGEGVDLIERGAGILLRGLMAELAPQMDQMSR